MKQGDRWDVLAKKVIVQGVTSREDLESCYQRRAEGLEQAGAPTERCEFVLSL